MWFLALKSVHVLLAITAVGANLTYGIWLARARLEPSALPFVLRNIAFIDSRVANPCYVLLLVTGLTMAFTVPIPLTTPWLLTALVLYVLAALLGIFIYAPAFRGQLTIVEREGFDSPAYAQAALRSTLLGILVTMDVLFIVFLMVFKPSLWG